MRQSNPFIYNVPVSSDRFIGRRQQINQILGQIASPARSSSAISGDPRVGKTSLIHYLSVPDVHEQWGLSSTWCHFLYVDCQGLIPFNEATFWRYVLRELERHLSDDETLIECTQSILSHPPPDIFDLNNLFDQISRAGRLVVLMLDEFEAIIANLDRHSPELLYRLRTLLNRPERGLTLTVASREPLDQLCGGIHFAGSPFDNSFSLIKLLPFSDAEVDELLTKYQVDISASERAFLRQTAGTHPYLVQLTGALIIRAREHQTMEKSSPSQLEVGLERDTERYFSNLLYHSSETEKMLLIWLALAQLAQKLSLDLLRLGRLPKYLGPYDQDLNRLVERGLVQYKARRPFLFSSIFGRWILRKLVVAADRAKLSDWQSLHASFLSPSQQEFFKDLVEKIRERPAIITNPELLKDFTRDDRQQMSASFVSPADSIRLTGSVHLIDKQERDVIKQLYGNENPNIAQVHLEKEFHGGLSGARVILAQSIDNRSRGLAHEVIKIAPATMLRREHNRYQKFIKGRLPATAVRLENGPVELGTMGCLSYGFAGDRPVGAIMDLEDYYTTHSATEIINTLTNLTDTLDDRWYGQGEPLLTSFADEYGQQLPAHLRLEAISISTSKDISVSSYRIINPDTILQTETQLNIGERVAISGLMVNQVTPEVVKLRSIGDGSVIWIRARVAMPRLDLQEEDRVVVLGIIERRRDDVLKTAVTNILNFTSDIKRQPNNVLHLFGLEQPCPNPLAICKQVLKQQLNGRQTIIHGDLHPGNILVDEVGRAWLIDFDHVREGHVLFDFVRLETHLRLFVLGGVRRKKQGDIPAASSTSTDWPHSFTLLEYVAFETNLIRKTLNHPAELITHPDLAKAAEVIMAIRGLAQHYLRRRNDWNEYLTGLFLQNLAQLRFYQDQPELGVLPFITAAVVGREIAD